MGPYNLYQKSEKLNSETAVVFQSDIVSTELAKRFYEDDLAYSRQVTPRKIDEFNEPTAPLNKLKKTIRQTF